MAPRKPSPPGKPGESNAIASMRSGVRKLASLLMWVVLIAIVAWGTWAWLIKPRGIATEGRQTPDGVYETYSFFVRDYVPPSTLTPGDHTVAQWLTFFDGDSQRWFRENADDLAAIAMRTQPESPDDVSSRRREMEAMRFVLTRGPLRGGVTRNVRVDEEGGQAALEVVTGTLTSRLSMTKARSGWVFTDMMGQRQTLDAELTTHRTREAATP